MKVIRPIAERDLPALLHMARTAGAGFTSLPPDERFLGDKLALSTQSFAAQPKAPGHERYLFVMEDSDTGEVGACCAIEAACGLDEAFYNYRIGTTVHACRELSIYNRVPTLYLSNDYTGTSVLCSLYMTPAFRGQGVGKLLSRCRFLFMGAHPARFADKVIAEMRGVSNEQGRSPFWEGLGRHFFSVDYDHAEHIVGMGNKAFIAELMPPHPIYAVLLPQEAQAVMGKVHPQTAPALHLLETEGFRYQGYIDIFDGGPTVEAPRQAIRTIAKSRLYRAATGWDSANLRSYLVSNTAVEGFRACLAEAGSDADGNLHLAPAVLAALQISVGDACLASPL